MMSSCYRFWLRCRCCCSMRPRVTLSSAPQRCFKSLSPRNPCVSAHQCRPAVFPGAILPHRPAVGPQSCRHACCRVGAAAYHRGRRQLGPAGEMIGIMK